MAKAKVTWNDAESATENARAKLPSLAQDYFERGRALAAGEVTPEALHEFRLRTKRFRYTLEMFRPFYGPGLDACLAALRQVQDHLGAVSDYAATRQAMGELLPAPSPLRRKLERFLDGQTAERTERFRDYWRNTFDAPAQDARWRRYLGRSR